MADLDIIVNPGSSGNPPNDAPSLQAALDHVHAVYPNGDLGAATVDILCNPGFDDTKVTFHTFTTQSADQLTIRGSVRNTPTFDFGASRYVLGMDGNLDGTMAYLTGCHCLVQDVQFAVKQDTSSAIGSLIDIGRPEPGVTGAVLIMRRCTILGRKSMAAGMQYAINTTDTGGAKWTFELDNCLVAFSDDSPVQPGYLVSTSSLNLNDFSIRHCTLVNGGENLYNSWGMGKLFNVLGAGPVFHAGNNPVNLADTLTAQGANVNAQTATRVVTGATGISLVDKDFATFDGHLQAGSDGIGHGPRTLPDDMEGDPRDVDNADDGCDEYVSGPAPGPSRWGMLI